VTADVLPFRPVYGATADEWLHFQLVVGAADLLPVVSRPGAVISPQSTLKGLGKTPSTYNGNRQVVGIRKWTDPEKPVTDADVARWAADSDHGICVRTNRVRTLDVDSTDPVEAAAIAEVIRRHLGDLPVRSRSNSSKFLVAFELAGQLAKRSFKTPNGAVEFLAGGQQFVAVGTHPSGERYEWLDGLPVFPTRTQMALEACWAELVETFAVEPASEGAASIARDRADIEGLADPVAEYLHEQGLVVGHQGEKVFVDCPWKEGHTSDSGVSETAWLIAGTKGFQQGHFQCMHASCAKREDVEFLDAIGFRAAAFTDLGSGEDGGDAGAGDAEPSAPEDMPWPKFRRNPTTGKIEATLDNIQRALACPPMVEMTVRYDSFRDDLMVEHGGGPNGGPSWYEPFTDADAVQLRIVLEQRGFKSVGKELMRDALLIHARDNTFDSAQDWLTSLPAWDGVERVASLLPRLFATDDTPYTRAVGLYLFTALAGRVMDPGCKADMVPILQGAQGQRKSTVVSELVPHQDMFRELSLHKLDADLSRRLRGCVVGELAELQGLKTRDAESIKAWIVQREERWVPKFVERETSFPRRVVLVATANPPDLLDDETGERRWLPVEIKGQIDTAGLIAERDQLWAEGLLRWRLDGIAWQDAERLAKPEHIKFKVRDGWTPMVERWLHSEIDVGGQTYWDRGWVLLADVAQGAVDVRASSLTRAVEVRLGKCMRALGWSSKPHRVDGRVLWAWVKG